MSKQSEAKERQCYTPKLIPSVCGNCAHKRSTITEHPAEFSWSKPYTTEKDLRCAIGGFAVRKMGSCSEWAGTSEHPEADKEKSNGSL
ncbi:MAG TPA: hypothetical protein VF453_06395 [Burkholderiaceae bacterium]